MVDAGDFNRLADKLMPDREIVMAIKPAGEVREQHLRILERIQMRYFKSLTCTLTDEADEVQRGNVERATEVEENGRMESLAVRAKVEGFPAALEQGPADSISEKGCYDSFSWTGL